MRGPGRRVAGDGGSVASRDHLGDRFYQFAETIGEVLWMTDFPKREILYVNPAYEEVWDRSREELYADPTAYLEAVHPRDREGLREAIHESPEFDVEYRIVRPDGETRWIRDRAAPITDDAGEVTHAVGLATDITDQRTVERALRAEHELNERIIETTPVGIVVVDGGEITYANDRASEVLGETPEDRVEELFPALWSDDAGDRERVRRFERELERPDGRRRLVQVNAATLHDGEETTGAVYAFEDVTKRRQRERTLVALHEATQWMMRAETPDEVAEVVTDAATEILGFSLVGVYRFDEEEYALIPRAVSSDVPETFERIPVFRGDDSLAWDAFVEGELAVYDDIRAIKEVSNELPVRSQLVVPIGTHGILITGSPEVAAFGEEDVRLAQVLAANTEAALERADRELELRERERELRRANAELERLTHLTGIIREVTSALVGASTREGVIDAVCDRLAAAEPYRAAWIGEYDPTTETIELRGWDGVGDPPAPSIDVGGDGPPTPATEAVRRGETRVVDDLLEERRYGSRRSEALSLGYRTIAAVPITHRDHRYGVLVVYARGPTMGARERAVLTELGETVGYALDAITTRLALVSDSRTEVVFGVSDPSLLYVRLATETRGRIDHRGTVVRSDGTDLLFVTVSGVDGDRLRSALESDPAVESVRIIADDGEELLVELSVERSFVHQVTDHGGRVRSFSAEGGRGTLTIELPTGSDVRAFADTFVERHPSAELLGRRDLETGLRSRSSRRSEPVGDLTDRQFEILQAAYHAGFFDSPRRHTGTEIAEQLGIDQSTFHRTIRTAQRSVFDALLD
ncbi:bacterio-opsin activator domain-containing protein [Natronorarus salvus]|uniref:bacterio-opsin activator domain-containing protein n=1 Tax=Natronorarus salvus TaxID=3117733 RepID=UPI002F267006